MKRNKFNLSHYKLTTFDQGQLIPCGVLEVLPGDTFQMSTSALIRVTPLLAPVMHPVQVRVHHWYVPYRLVWDNFEKFITGGPDGFDASVFPTKTNSPGVKSLADYLGLPTGTSITYSALPTRAYQLIFNEWYRDQDLVTLANMVTTDGNDTGTSSTLQSVAWEKDYFTSARPWLQKGPEVTIPLVGEAPIKGIGVAPTSTVPVAGPLTHKESTGVDRSYANSFAGAQWASSIGLEATDGTANADPKVFADLTGVGAANINDLRLAFALQRYEEARARYGSRYTEYLRYLGVRSSDARLQRPEYLGGGKQTIQFSEVLQTTPDVADPDTGVGDLKGHGIGAMRSNRFRKFFEEHGVILSLISVKPRTMYTQGVPRMFSRRTKEDFWQKELEHIGQQEIANKEIYAAAAAPDGVFGYQDRYDEYRRQESQVTGEFRTTSLDYWHMARQFAAEPVLNSSFVQSNPTKRIYAEQTDNSLWVMINHRVTARRMLSRTGTSHIF